MSLSKKDLSKILKLNGLRKKSICLHSSFRSLGQVSFKPHDLIDVFLDHENTIIVPTHSFGFGASAPADNRPERNGFDYDDYPYWQGTGDNLIYSTASNDIDLHEMGIIPKTILDMKERVRGNHPLCSFTGIGPFAHELIKSQSPMDVFAPLRELALFKGIVVLAGVDYTRLTLLHLAEQMAGRNMFIRWAKSETGEIYTAETGGCSEGFSGFEGYFTGFENKIMVGESLWRILDAGRLLKTAARVIQLKPETTRCSDKECLRCSDAIAGGPNF